MARIEQAIILAAGEGQRLKPFTALRPKVMLPIANKPILSYVVEAVAGNGIPGIIMVVGYKKEQVQDYFGSGERFGVSITYVTQKYQVGTAQALRVAQNAATEGFLVLPGDNIIEPSTISGIVEAPLPTMLTKRSDNVSKYGVVAVENGLVRKIAEKPREATGNIVNTGIYVLGRGVFDFLKGEKDLTAALQNMIVGGTALHAEETAGPWLDVVYPWDILALNSVALGRVQSVTGGVVEAGCTTHGPVRIGEGSTIRSGSYLAGPLIIGQGCEIGPSACIGPSTSIGDNVSIGPFTYIVNTVIGDNVRIGPGSSLRDSVIGADTELQGHFTARSGAAAIEIDSELHHISMGAMVGDNCEVADNVVIQPGILVGNYCRVRPLRVVSENLPDRALAA